MTFKSLMSSNLKFEIIKQHVLNLDTAINNYCISDAGKKTPYYFMCPNCKSSSISIDDSMVAIFNSKKIKIDSKALIENGGTGSYCKLINCENCNTYYFVAIGYTEPNYGRDVLLLHSILELAAVKS